MTAPTATTAPDSSPAVATAQEATEGRADAELLARVGGKRVSLSFRDKVEAFIARLSTRNRFWHLVCSSIYLPYAFRSGLKMKKVDERTFSAELPYKRFNRNWYNAMAGAALLGNSEIAAGSYIMGITGGDYTIVCKQLEYRFLRPCYGPARYIIVPREDIAALITTTKEFNITLDIEVIQQAVLPERLAKLRKKDPLMAKIASKERKVGRCVATFHVTPTIHQKTKRGDTRRVG